MNDLCIMVAPNGARRTPADHPALPVTPAALARTARACQEAGASAVHLHVRDEALRHSLSPQAYRQAIAAIEEAAPGLVIQTTTESAGIFSLDDQVEAATALAPACLSFALAEVIAQGEARGMAVLHDLQAAGTGVQIILYTPAQIHDCARLIDAGSLPVSDLPRLLLVAGRYSATLDSDPAEFDALHRALVETGLAEAALWMTCAFGRGEMAILERTIALGGHVRVGFENAITDAEGRPARDNAERVAMVAAIARRLGREPGGPGLARRVLGQRGERALLHPWTEQEHRA
ncbi:3-keto-5-aminohexanoate cleavage protein [Pararhodobacter sp.]|uniref:3-keto-5-aminohexanoate cleavage protein n=1 Tax=Pararhodobacter sp. TaxID=2127056 RepID=UPI002AFE9FB8|nr:3-keto-5-aminohexanoate cleavage protein [Pararhodobacter sp.]